MRLAERFGTPAEKQIVLTLAGPAASSESKPLLARDSLSGAADNQGIVRLLALTDAINTGVQSLIKPLPAPRHCM